MESKRTYYVNPEGPITASKKPDRERIKVRARSVREAKIKARIDRERDREDRKVRKAAESTVIGSAMLQALGIDAIKGIV